MKYQKISTWGLQRTLNKQPHSFLFDLNDLDSRARLFKLQGQPFILCSDQQLNDLDLNQNSHVDFSIDTAKKISHFSLSSRQVDLRKWLNTLQRYFAVLLTHHIEHEQHLSISLHNLINMPIRYALFQLIFQSDLRKSVSERDQRMNTFISELSLNMVTPSRRLFSCSNGSMGLSTMRRRRLLKLMSEVSGNSQQLKLYDFWSIIEWEKQVTESIIWVLIILNLKPEWLQQVKEEVYQINDLEAYQVEHLDQAPKLTCLIYEVLRLAAPHWLTNWGNFKSHVEYLGANLNYLKDLHPKTQLLTAPLLSHRNSFDWPSPHVFQPERFLGIIHGATVPPSFMPFGPKLDGYEKTLATLHTVSSVLISILRRGCFTIAENQVKELKVHLHSDDVLSREDWVGVGFGVPIDLLGRLVIDDNYIYIPSARI